MRKIAFPVALLAMFFVITSFHPATLYNSSYYVVIDKSRYELSVFDSKGWLVTFPVVFGSTDLNDKLYAGDRRTPEGTFTIINKKVHSKWDRFLSLDYPTQESYSKFNERKNEGIIPSTAKIGGSIGIHGTWPHEDYQVDRFRNWTEGCISMRNKDVEELYNLVPVGTKVLIRK